MIVEILTVFKLKYMKKSFNLSSPLLQIFTSKVYLHNFNPNQQSVTADLEYVQKWAKMICKV